MASAVTVSTIAAITSMAGITGISIFAVLLLIGMLIAKDLVVTYDGSRQQLISRCLNISIFPLLLSFAVVFALKVFELLG